MSGARSQKTCAYPRAGRHPPTPTRERARPSHVGPPVRRAHTYAKLPRPRVLISRKCWKSTNSSPSFKRRGRFDIPLTSPGGERMSRKFNALNVVSEIVEEMQAMVCACLLGAAQPEAQRVPQEGCQCAGQRLLHVLRAGQCIVPSLHSLVGLLRPWHTTSPGDSRTGRVSEWEFTTCQRLHASRAGKERCKFVQCSQQT